MVYGKLKKYSLTIFIILAAVLLYLWGGSEKTYRTNNINIKVVSGEGLPIANALVVASWQDRCAPHGSLRAVVFAVEKVANVDGIATFPGMEIETLNCIDQSQPSIGVFHSGYDFIGRTIHSKIERVGIFEYKLIYDDEFIVTGRECSDCLDFNTKVDMVLSAVEYHEMSLDQKKNIPMLKAIVDEAEADRGKQEK